MRLLYAQKHARTPVNADMYVLHAVCGHAEKIIKACPPEQALMPQCGALRRLSSIPCRRKACEMANLDQTLLGRLAVELRLSEQR